MRIMAAENDQKPSNFDGRANIKTKGRNESKSNFLMVMNSDKSNDKSNDKSSEVTITKAKITLIEACV